MEQKRKLISVLFAIGIFALVALIMYISYTQLKPKAVEGKKEIVVEVVIPEDETKEFTIKTDAEFLSQALEEKNLIKGEVGEYGLMINEVNGRQVDSSKNEWWMITKDGVMTDYGADAQPIMDGEHYELTLSTY